MKRILIATGLGLSVLTFTMAGTTNQTAPVGAMINDTTPQDTIRPDTTLPTDDQPTPAPEAETNP